MKRIYVRSDSDPKRSNSVFDFRIKLKDKIEQSGKYLFMCRSNRDSDDEDVVDKYFIYDVESGQYYETDDYDWEFIEFDVMTYGINTAVKYAYDDIMYLINHEQPTGEAQDSQSFYFMKE